ncbi:MAG: DUF3024 domain-containing protein [Candidatus Eisenbacteria sp.]|nr:DUF3024 domain-containing protein [Candidatus Eisenbacteria bacterium]
MSLPALVRQHLETKLSTYCQQRIPLHMRDQIRIGFKIRGNSVTLFEERPSFRDPSEWGTIAIAQMRYEQDARTWKLFSTDRSSKWHAYRDLSPQRRLDAVLDEIDDDPTGIFWG